MVPKFRAWDGQDMVMRDVEQLRFAHNSNNHVVYITIDAEEWATGPALILMQSTGLKDKNGVEIFEGDVVSLTEGECSYSGIVVRDYYEFYIKGIGPIDCFDFQDVSNTFDGTTSLEVTTNIYKNPELLEQANES